MVKYFNARKDYSTSLLQKKNDDIWVFISNLNEESFGNNINGSVAKKLFRII